MKKLVAMAALTPTLLLALSAQAQKWEATTQERQEMLRSVKVWKDPGNIAAKNLLQGPGDKYRVHQLVECKFFDSSFTEVSDTGKTEKFWCFEPGSNKDTKVKYDTDNGEVFAEVVSSRILGAIGFFTDTAYPIQVACENCPEEPWRYMNYMAQYHGAPSSIRARGQSNEERLYNASVYLERAQKVRTQKQAESLQRTGQPYKKMFEVALSESKYDGKAIYSPEQRKAGIGLNELGAIDASRGGSTAAEIDALKLAVAFIKHGDNKADNQRLVCPDENITTGANGRQTCTNAHLVLQDIGSTMGIGVITILGVDIGPNEKAKLSYEGWQKTPVWRDAASCRTNLGDNMIGGTLSDPTVSEAGRQMLAGLLMQLTDSQLADVFTAARVDKRTGQRAYSVDQWVQLFKSKRAEIVNARCPR